MMRKSVAVSAKGLKPCCCATHSFLGRKFRIVRPFRAANDGTRAVCDPAHRIEPENVRPNRSDPAVCGRVTSHKKRKRLTACSVQRCFRRAGRNQQEAVTMSKLVACSFVALLMIGNASLASAQNFPQGMPQNLEQLQSGQFGQQNGQNWQYNQNGQNNQYGQQGQNNQYGQQGQQGQSGQQASAGSKRQKQPKMTEEQRMIQQYVPQQYQQYLQGGMSGAGGGMMQ